MFHCKISSSALLQMLITSLGSACVSKDTTHSCLLRLKTCLTAHNAAKRSFSPEAGLSWNNLIKQIRYCKTKLQRMQVHAVRRQGSESDSCCSVERTGGGGRFRIPEKVSSAKACWQNQQSTFKAQLLKVFVSCCIR